MHIIAQLRSCFGASEVTLWKEKLWFTNLLRYCISLIYFSSTGEISFVFGVFYYLQLLQSFY